MSISLYTKAGQDRTSNESRQAYIERLIQHDRIKRLGSGATLPCLLILRTLM